MWLPVICLVGLVGSHLLPRNIYRCGYDISGEANLSPRGTSATWLVMCGNSTCVRHVTFWVLSRRRLCLYPIGDWNFNILRPGKDGYDLTDNSILFWRAIIECHLNFAEIFTRESIWQTISIALANGLVLHRRQAIIWTKWWHIKRCMYSSHILTVWKSFIDRDRQIGMPYWLIVWCGVRNSARTSAGVALISVTHSMWVVG